MGEGMNRSAIAAYAAFIATIPAANYTLERVGFVDVPGLGPVASGVAWAGLAFVLRDVAQMLTNKWATLPAIAAGALLSAWLASPALAVASAAAFALSEALDWAIYSPLANRHFTTAVASSSVIGGAVDSAVFLQLAFGSTRGWWQLGVAKAVLVAAAIPLAKAVKARAVPVGSAVP